MSKSRNKIVMIIPSVMLTLIVGVLVVYYCLGIGFGNAIIKTAHGIKDAKKEWAKDELNPVDSIKNQVVDMAKNSIKQ